MIVSAGHHGDGFTQVDLDLLAASDHQLHEIAERIALLTIRKDERARLLRVAQARPLVAVAPGYGSGDHDHHEEAA
ncbi:hypothetical protein BS329_15580 [Amycolatopsis coloradensis]|uniref:Uncharacterized protein n=1 Tax=Amycolatopsis coloradensis TaxID=76021 RepID=A0A1R0KU96_9PSEU|nr:hypothetical protein [Amycolatopsis coloradensis]OLZ51684.1 hypothetical protein BS329_15580 [Amycolatopsis coloradensis]